MKDKSRKKERGQRLAVTNMVDINPGVSITTLNVNRLNTPIKRNYQNG